MAYAPEPARERTRVLADWEALRYGMFIHYGMSTFTGHEFGRIPAEVEDYAPADLDVDQWIRTARDAGMRYAVLTAKHHYGHALWPSDASDYTVRYGADRRDVVKLFVRACDAYGIKPGFYYSAGWDRRHQPRMTEDRYLAFVLEQVEELLTWYGPITEMWFDIPWDLGTITAEALSKIYRCCKRLQPDCLVLWNQGFVDGATVNKMEPTYQGAKVSDDPVHLWPKDVNNGERMFPPPEGHNPRIVHEGVEYYIPNEVCDSTGQRRWFWGEEDDVRPARHIYEIYRNSIGRGSNLLLNLGPDRCGRIPQDYVDRLLEVKGMIERPETVQDSLLLDRPVEASNVRDGDEEKWGPHLAVDMDVTPEGGTRWATDDGVRSAWLEADLGGSRAVGRFTASECGDAIRAFELQVPGPAGAWIPVHRGTTVGGPGIDVQLEPVVANRLRMEIMESAAGPSLWDIAAFEPR